MLVNPTRSANSTDTSRRSAIGSTTTTGTGGWAAGAAATATSGDPHSPQNFVPGSLPAPHCEHGCASTAPHSPQNLRPGPFVVPHAAQFTGQVYGPQGCKRERGGAD